MAEAMNYAHNNRRTSIYMTSNTFHPTNTPPSQPQLAVEFDFFVKHDRLIIVEGRSPMVQQLHPLRPSYLRASASAAVTGGESWEGMMNAVYGAIGDCLNAGGLSRLVSWSWEEVGRRFLSREGAVKEGGVLRLGFEVWVEDWHVYMVTGGGGGGRGGSMVPAAESSFEMLEEYEVTGAEEEGCCICLEGLGGGGGAERMPCLHVFHGGCIRRWLRQSHYCPLCRYEMPSSIRTRTR